MRASPNAHKRSRHLWLGAVALLLLSCGAYLVHGISKRPEECWANNPGTAPTIEEAAVWEETCHKYHPKQ